MELKHKRRLLNANEMRLKIKKGLKSSKLCTHQILKRYKLRQFDPYKINFLNATEFEIFDMNNYYSTKNDSNLFSNVRNSPTT